MTIVRYQIHCVVSKNDAVIIVIEDDCDATAFQCRSAQGRFAHVHHVTCDLDQDSSTAVRHRVSVNHFLSVVLQCHVVRCHSFNVCRTHHWKLRCDPGWADRSKTSRIDHQLVLLSLVAIGLIFPIHPVPTFLACCLPARISRVPHLRVQSCSLETEFDCGADVFGVQVSSTCLLLSLSLISVCHFGFRLP